MCSLIPHPPKSFDFMNASHSPTPQLPCTYIYTHYYNHHTLKPVVPASGYSWLPERCRGPIKGFWDCKYLKYNTETFKKFNSSEVFTLFHICYGYHPSVQHYKHHFTTSQKPSCPRSNCLTKDTKHLLSNYPAHGLTHDIKTFFDQRSQPVDVVSFLRATGASWWQKGLLDRK